MSSSLNKKIGQAGHLVPKPQCNLIKREDTRIFTKANLAIFLMLGLFLIVGSYFGVIRRYQEIDRLNKEFISTTEQYETAAAEAAMFRVIQDEHSKYNDAFIRENALFSSITNRKEILNIVNDNVVNKLNVAEIKTTENLVCIQVEKTTLEKVTSVTSQLKINEPNYVKNVELTGINTTKYNNETDERGNMYIDLTIWVQFITEG